MRRRFQGYPKHIIDSKCDSFNFTVLTFAALGFAYTAAALATGV
jgi:hypothetical protein